MMHKKVMLLAIVSLTGVGLVYFIFDLGTVDTYKDRSDASNMAVTVIVKTCQTHVPGMVVRDTDMVQPTAACAYMPTL